MIAAYQFEPADISPSASQALPFHEMPHLTCTVLDAITMACEEGLLDENRWVSQCFANGEVFDDFLRELGEYDECFRIHDRWYQALMRLADQHDEEGFVASLDIAEALLNRAHQSGQLEG